MQAIEEVLRPLPKRHVNALLWFHRNAGTVTPWPRPIPAPDGETLLATKAKGIYKPAWTAYALSIRQTVDGPYPDRDPVVRADGTWVYHYFQENASAAARDEEFTNRGLLACWRDSVPGGVLRQVRARPAVQYRVLGVALVAGWEGGYFFLERFGPNGEAHKPGAGAELEVLEREQQAQAATKAAFDPRDIIDARERIIAQIVRRRGQPQFRKALLDAYAGRCAVSGCDAAEALEAAHIIPYLGPATNTVNNGLLLRADLHTLFDLGFFAVDPEAMTILVAPALRTSAYGALMGRPLTPPVRAGAAPSTEALAAHRRWTGL